MTRRMWVKESFLEALVVAVASALVDLLAWILRRTWKRRKRNKRKEEARDAEAEPD